MRSTAMHGARPGEGRPGGWLGSIVDIQAGDVGPAPPGPGPIAAAIVPAIPRVVVPGVMPVVVTEPSMVVMVAMVAMAVVVTVVAVMAAMVASGGGVGGRGQRRRADRQRGQRCSQGF